MPINLDTINQFLGTDYTAENVDEYFERHKTHPHAIDSVKDVIESQIGSESYHAFYEHYTEKQWGLPCDKLPPEIISRIPIRRNRDNRYFTQRYQALPREGYTRVVENILSHPDIHILLNTNYKDIRNDIQCDHLYYSGSIDEYFEYCFGRLPYRSVSFQFETYPVERYQPAAVVNYPNNYNYTRITEFKQFYHVNTANTVIAKEIPGSNGDPSYPIPTNEARELYKKYASLPHKGVTFIGRLGEYRYYSMDQVMERMMELPTG